MNRQLGCGTLGLGCMGMVNPNRNEDYIKVIHKALDAGITFLNTGDFYGHGKSELALGNALKGRRREEAYISVKFGVMREPNGRLYGLDVRPDSIKNYLTYTLSRLRLDYIDLYQPARMDEAIPVEEVIGAISELVDAGYVRDIGITQVDSETLRRANAVHKIRYVESEYSLFNRSIEKNIIPTAKELGIDVVAFGALAHGLLSGSFTKEKSQFMSRIPMMRPENIDQNLLLVKALTEIADEKQISLPQLAIAWLLHQDENIVTLVGASRLTSLNDSMGAADIHLDPSDLKRIEDVIPPEKIAGDSMPKVTFRNGKLI